MLSLKSATHSISYRHSSRGTSLRSFSKQRKSEAVKATEEDIEFDPEELELERMEIIDDYTEEMKQFKAGEVEPQILDGVRVEAYGELCGVSVLGYAHKGGPNRLLFDVYDEELVPLIMKNLDTVLDYAVINQLETAKLEILIPTDSDELREKYSYVGKFPLG